MPSERTMAELRYLERLEDERRRLNRQMVDPTRHPDSGDVLPGPVLNRFAATAAASAETRRRLMLPPKEPAPRTPQPGPLSRKKWVRPLDLCLAGATKAQTAQILGMTQVAVDGALRRAYRSLGVHNLARAGAVWRTRAATEGHVMNDDDARALREITSAQQDPAQALTPREEQAMAFLAQGIARRDLPVAMGISTSTIHSYLHSAYKKLGASGLRDAVQRYLARRGAIGQPPFERPMAENFDEGPLDLEVGSRAGSDDDLGVPPERYCPP